jgi:hypothetical protein
MQSLGLFVMTAGVGVAMTLAACSGSTSQQPTSSTSSLSQAAQAQLAAWKGQPANGSGSYEGFVGSTCLPESSLLAIAAQSCPQGPTNAIVLNSEACPAKAEPGGSTPPSNGDYGTGLAYQCPTACASPAPVPPIATPAPSPGAVCQEQSFPVPPGTCIPAPEASALANALCSQLLPGSIATNATDIAACSCNGVTASSVQCALCSSPPPPPPPPCGSTFSIPIPLGECLSPAEGEKAGQALCQANGGTLSSFDGLAPCPNGKGYEAAAVVCSPLCVPPPPPPPPPTCGPSFQIALPAGICESAEDGKAEATKICASNNGTFDSFVGLGPCDGGGGYTATAITCDSICPPAPDCSPFQVPLPAGLCEPAATGKELAAQICQASGAEFVSFVGLAECSGGYTASAVNCEAPCAEPVSTPGSPPTSK